VEKNKYFNGFPSYPNMSRILAGKRTR